MRSIDVGIVGKQYVELSCKRRRALSVERFVKHNFGCLLLVVPVVTCHVE